MADQPALPDSSRDPRPRSAVRHWVAMLGAACALACFYWLRQNPQINPTFASFLFLLSFFLPILALEFWLDRSYRNPSTGLDWDRAPRRLVIGALVRAGFSLLLILVGTFLAALAADDQARAVWADWLQLPPTGLMTDTDPRVTQLIIAAGVANLLGIAIGVSSLWTVAVEGRRRALVKLLGLFSTFATLAFAYALFPEWSRGIYLPFYMAFAALLPLICAWAPIYITLIDHVQVKPRDGTWQVGALMMGWYDEVSVETVRQYALGWLIKGFFLPIMYGSFHNNLIGLRQASFSFSSFDAFFHTGWHLLILVDVAVIVVGYGLTLRLLDNHIRSAEPTMSGWAVALICYEPFSRVLGGSFLPYGDGAAWRNLPLMAEYPWLKVLCGSISLVAMAIYTWASVSFGLRFSNLTHRGIITNGPYRFTKHPAYVFKNFAWWMEALPFIGGYGRMEALRNCLRLLLINLIYYLRARTEERHLSRDPDYVAYAEWINRNGIFRWVGRWISWIRYRPPPR